MTTDEVRGMAGRYGEVAAWAREAGYDGIQLGSANAKLLDQFLSPFYNRRRDEFGGSLERRASILRLIRAAVAARAGADFPCTVKVPVETAPPGLPRATESEALELARLVQEWGFDAVTPVRVSVSLTRRCRAATRRTTSAPTRRWRGDCVKRRRVRCAARR
jgi:2,4-dienoyl-CoA reductase-like NADH-dependent reductase (Old Yellow Enzyme family)